MHTWALQDATAHFSAVIHAVNTEGAQRISVPGQQNYVLLPEPEYQRLQHQKPRFLDFMASSPLHGLALEIQRDRSLPAHALPRHPSAGWDPAYACER